GTVVVVDDVESSPGATVASSLVHGDGAGGVPVVDGASVDGASTDVSGGSVVPAGAAVAGATNAPEAAKVVATAVISRVGFIGPRGCPTLRSRARHAGGR